VETKLCKKGYREGKIRTEKKPSQQSLPVITFTSLKKKGDGITGGGGGPKKKKKVTFARV